MNFIEFGLFFIIVFLQKLQLIYYTVINFLLVGKDVIFQLFLVLSQEIAFARLQNLLWFFTLCNNLDGRFAFDYWSQTCQWVLLVKRVALNRIWQQWENFLMVICFWLTLQQIAGSTNFVIFKTFGCVLKSLLVVWAEEPTSLFFSLQRWHIFNLNIPGSVHD